MGLEKEFVKDGRVVLFIVGSVGTSGLDGFYLTFVLLRIMPVSLRTERRSSQRHNLDQHQCLV